MTRSKNHRCFVTFLRSFPTPLRLYDFLFNDADLPTPQLEVDPAEVNPRSGRRFSPMFTLCSVWTLYVFGSAKELTSHIPLLKAHLQGVS